MTVGTCRISTAAYSPSSKLVFAVIGLLGAATLLSGFSKRSRRSCRERLGPFGCAFMGRALAMETGAPPGPCHPSDVHCRGAGTRCTGLAVSRRCRLAHVAYYMETLSPDSSAYDAGNRTWDYPIDNLLYAFTKPNWLLGKWHWDGISWRTVCR